VLRLGRLSLLKRFGPGMKDSLNRVQFLNMKNDAFVGACTDEKSAKPEDFSQRKLACLFSHLSKGNRLDT